MPSIAGSAAQQKIDFMTLLVTELQNQNPLEPMNHQQMAAQLAQFTQLELTENMTGSMDNMTKTMDSMSNSFQGAMLIQQMEYAKSMLGKQITFHSAETGKELTGQVTKITFNNGLPMLHAKGVDAAGAAKDYQVELVDVTGLLM